MSDIRKTEKMQLKARKYYEEQLVDLLKEIYHKKASQPYRMSLSIAMRLLVESEDSLEKN